MKNQSRIEELLSDLLRSSDRQSGELKGLNSELKEFKENTNSNFTHIDMNLKMLLKQFELMNEKFDKVIDLNDKFKALEMRVKALESKST